MVRAIRPALRVLASIPAPRRLGSGSTSAASTAFNQDDTVWPEAHAGPSRQTWHPYEQHLRQRDSSAFAQREAEALTERDAPTAFESEGPVRRTTVGTNRAQARRGQVGFKGKGKARLVDEDQPAWLTSDETAMCPQPRGFKTPAHFYLPSRDELLAAAAREHEALHSTWKHAFQQAYFDQAMSVLERAQALLISKTSFKARRINALLFLRLLHFVRLPADVELALDHFELYIDHIGYRCHALGLLLERAVRDLQAAHLIQPIQQRNFDLVRAFENQQRNLEVTSSRICNHQARLRPRRDHRRMRAHRRLSSHQAGHQLAVQDLLARMAFLLPNLTDERSHRAAYALLAFVAARTRHAWTRRRRRRTLSPWQPPRSWLHLLQPSGKGRRQDSSHLFDPEFLMAIARALLDTSRFGVKAHSPAALDTTIWIPPPLCARQGAIRSWRRGLTSHLSFSRQARWLPCDLARLCVSIIDTVATQGRKHLVRLSAFDIEPVVLAAVRDGDFEAGRLALLDLFERQWPGYASDSSSCKSALAVPSTRRHGTAGASVRHAEKTQAYSTIPAVEQDYTLLDEQMPQIFVLLNKINTHGPRRPRHIEEVIAASNSFQQIVTKVFYETIAHEPKYASLAKLGHKKGSKTKHSVQQTRATLRDVVSGIEMVAQSQDHTLADVLAWFDLDQDGKDLPKATGDTFSSGNVDEPTQLKQVPVAYGNAMRGFALRGALDGCDALFHAYLRRATSGDHQYRFLTLSSQILYRRWRSVMIGTEWMRVHHTRANTRVPGTRVATKSRYVRHRAIEIGNLIGLDVASTSMLEDKVAGTRSSDSGLPTNTVASVRIEPSARLLAHMIKGIASWSGDPFAGVKLFGETERRWPALCHDSEMLGSLLFASQRLVWQPWTNGGERPAKLLRTVMHKFRQHLFAQHPSLRGLQALPWRPIQARADLSTPNARETDWEENSQTSISSDVIKQRYINFDANLFEGYTFLLSALTNRLLLEEQRRSTSGEQEGTRAISRALGRLLDNLVFVLVWARRLNVRPTPDTLARVVTPLREVYRQRGWEWTSPSSSPVRSGERDVDGLDTTFGPLAAEMRAWWRPDEATLKAVAAKVASLDAKRRRRRKEASNDARSSTSDVAPVP